MDNIKIHVFHTGEVCVAPDLPFEEMIPMPLRHQEYLEKKKTVYGFQYHHT